MVVRERRRHLVERLIGPRLRGSRITSLAECRCYNGGIFEKSDVEQCLEMTGCDGVMSSRGYWKTQGSSLPTLLEGAYYANHLKLAEEYLDMCDKYPVWSFKTIRSHVQKIMYRYCVKHLDLRDRLLENVTVEGYRDCLRYVRDLQEEERNRERLEDDQEKAGLVNDAVDIKYNESWYHRHWASGTHANAREEGTGCLPEAMTEKRRLVAEQAEEFLTCPSGDDSEELGVLGALFSSE